MRTSPIGATKVALAVFLVAALVASGILFVMRRGDTDASRAVWSTGDAWTVTVRQQGANVAPSGKAGGTIVYRFRVASAPSKPGAPWRVDVHQDGATGPYADGWHLFYRQAKNGAMHLSQVAQGTQPRAKAEVAAIVLGMSFPYETTYRSAPKDRTVNEAQLISRSSTPPPATDSRVTGSTTVTSGGGVPPQDAPVVPAEQAPPGAPRG